mgnify:CR=1 FL=1
MAAVSRDGRNVIPSVFKMMRSLSHRGREAYGIATMDAIDISGSIAELSFSTKKSKMAIGYNLSRILPEDQPQPIRSDGFSLIFEGRIFPAYDETTMTTILRLLRDDPVKGSERILRELDGTYNFAILDGEKVIIGRDVIGGRPLYYGWSRDIYAVASELKALWAIGIMDWRPFPPGNMAIISGEGIIFYPVGEIVRVETEPMDMDYAAGRVGSLLSESVGERVGGINRVAIAFSGGLDSGLIAMIAKTYDVDIQLITAGLKDQPEVEHAREAAKMLNLPIHIKIMDERDVEKILPRVLWMVEEPNPVTVSIAIPFYWVAEATSELGFRVMFAGHGGDELFGGYYKYLGVYERMVVDGVREAIYNDVINSYRVNIDRDEKVCSFHNVELRLPFMDRELISFALSIPVNLKIDSPNDQIRKRVLRRAAERMGLPKIMSYRRKRAIQYATGVNKALRRLAKRRGMNLKKLIKQYWRELFSIQLKREKER